MDKARPEEEKKEERKEGRKEGMKEGRIVKGAEEEEGCKDLKREWVDRRQAKG